MKKKLIFLLIIPFLMGGCWNYNELNTLAIVTGFAIDYDDDKYKVSMLIANSKKNQSSSKEGESQTTVYSGKGKTISDAIKEIDRKSPKNVYIGHLGVVIISEEVAKNGVLEFADIMLRSAESRKKFYFLQAKGAKAEEVLSLVIPLESFPAQGISTLSKNTNVTQAITTTMPFSYFITDVLKPGISPTLPSIEIIGDPEEGQSSDALEKTKMETYLKISDMALYSDDKFVAYTENEESQVINLLNNESDSLITTIKMDKNQIGFNITEMKSKINLVDPMHVEVTLKGKAVIREINKKYDLENTKIINKMEKALNKTGKAKLSDTIDALQTKYKTDSLGFGNLIYQKYPEIWKQVENEWEDKYFQKIDVKVNTDFKIISTGSLKQTIKEAKWNKLD